MLLLLTTQFAPYVLLFFAHNITSTSTNHVQLVAIGASQFRHLSNCLLGAYVFIQAVYILSHFTRIDVQPFSKIIQVLISN